MGNIGNITANMDKIKTWFCNQNINKLEFNSKYKKYFNKKRDIRSKRKKSRTKKKICPQKQIK